MNTSRKEFIGGIAASFFIGGCATRCAPRKIGPNQKVNVAIIGCGRIARYTNLPGFLQDSRCRYDGRYDTLLHHIVHPSVRCSG